MSYLNAISFFGIFGLCFIAWLFSEDRRVIPWRVILWGIGLQLVLGFMVFLFPPTKIILEGFSSLLNGVFDAADAGSRFVFGPNIVPLPGRDPLILSPLASNNICPPTSAGQLVPGFCGLKLGYIFAFRALPTVIFFSGLMALLENIGAIQVIVNFFGWIFFRTMRLSGAESLSGAANIFVGIEAAIVVKPYLAKMTRSELCAILSCCFGTAASSTLAIYVGFLRPVFPNILGHLVSASIIAIPACFVLSKILVPETTVPVTMGGIPKAEKQPKLQNDVLSNDQDRDQIIAELIDEADEAELESTADEPMQRVSPLDAAILGALDGVKMSVSIAAVLILIVGLVFLINQIFGWLAGLQTFAIARDSFLFALKDAIEPVVRFVGQIFTVVNLPNIQGAFFYPLTLLTGVAWDESWAASVIIGRRLLETAIPPYQELGRAGLAGELSARTVVIVSYALSGFAHLASVGIFVGGTIALIPSRRKDITELGWKALFVGTLATMMIACISGVFFDPSNASILGEKTKAAPVLSPTSSPTISPSASPFPSASPDVSPGTPDRDATTSPSPKPTPKKLKLVPKTPKPTPNQ
jgi:concentrative nucleoside transporter, CNT family